MSKCIYCRQDKDPAEFTLEHVFPQFMGGAYAPDCFKTRSVCKPCNSNLGLFVDAGFEKNWFVSNRLRMNARAFFDPNSPVGLPLVCMGKSDFVPPQLQECEVCESWLGPFGEQVYWVRPHDERLFWYTGGNPRTTKTTESRAYFLFSERSEKNPLISLLSFRDAFEGRRVRKIMCTEVGDILTGIGFKAPDELDLLRVKYFNEACRISKTKHIQLAMYVPFDFRFLVKLGLGVAYSLFGSKALQTAYAEELYKALWYRNENGQPQINGSSSIMHGNNPLFTKVVGEANAVTIMIIPTPEGVAVNLNLGESLNWVIKCASYENLTEDDIHPLREGRVLLLYRQLQRAFDLALPEYIAHKCGNQPHPELTGISAKLALHRDYFKNL
ncbi:HNH endonuclease [Andreprevotia chitinilytica]|uniref:HNH endonuclease n=1 Tax=Andreprevotia chitinilytica TaxID=396808 RepID=UPI000554892F|nr:HNH endonuclease [Andreprevotia chitinilytica]